MTIVVSYPNATEGRPLVDAGVLHARRAGAELVLLHQAKLPDDYAHQPVDREMREIERTRSELESIADEIREQGVPCRVVVGTGLEADPSGPILDRVRKEQPEMLIIGMRSRSRVGKLLLGSTTQDLLLASECPVLAVKVPSNR